MTEVSEIVSQSVQIVEQPRQYPYDAIVVLGASMRWNEKRQRWDFPTLIPEEPGVVVAGKSRARAAFQAVQENLAPLVIVTGGVEHDKGHEASRAEELRREIIEMGVPADRITTLSNGGVHRGNTQGNMQDLADFLVGHPEIQRIGVLTNDFHVARSRMFMRQFLPSSVQMKFIQLNRLLNNRSPHYQRWLKILRERPEMRERKQAEKQGRRALREGSYQVRHS